jgi:YHS domain-containing protein
MSLSDGSFLKSSVPLTRLLVIAAIGFAVYGAWTWWHTPLQVDHRHDPGAHGGIIVAVGYDHYHVEALFTEGGGFKLFPLGQDQARVMTVPVQKITAYVRSPEITEAVPVTLEATPQPDDPPGQTSAFAGQLPLELIGARLLVVVPSITINNVRYRFSFMNQDEHQAEMPRKVTDEAERQLYLTPGGKLTAADIQANGSQTASQKYRGFRSVHDMHPSAGDLICPVTQTKANSNCTWIVNGKQYQFCCPPCIDEFVKLAKEYPEQIREPRDYIQK